ncbi:MAG TPA: gephyrin-like molybdotransferase Glp [Jatrophihabitans sp.]|nr:gephyrin-like molybdotransferase Glp [Jatrophihabitans sp.]
MIELAEARRRLLAACPVLEPARLHVDDAAGCVLAADVTAATAVPPFDNSSVDGFAVRAADVRGATPDRPVELAVLGSVLAGSVADAPVTPGTTWKVMTGAPLPAGADAVVMVEDSSAEQGDPRSLPGDRVRLFAAPRPGTGVRLAGSDVTDGALVLAAGTVLRPAHLGVLASVGVRQVPVYPRPRVGVLVTGDELASAGQPLEPGQIYESNRAMLMALVRRVGCEPVDLGIARDDRVALRSRLAGAVAECDVVLTCGGVSMGDADPVKAVLADLGRLNWLQVAIRPAKPFAFGVLDGPTLLMGLPGNPVSSLVSFELLAAPALRHLAGQREPFARPIKAILDADLPPARDDGRTGYLRVMAEFGPDGRLHARPVDRQDSHQLSASAAANGLAEVPPGASPRSGEELPVLLLS